MSVVNATHRAILAALNADTGVTAAVGSRIYESAPDGAAMPMIAVQSIEHAPEPTSDTDHERLTVSLSVFTTGARCRLDAHSIGAEVRRVLHRGEARVTPVGWRVVMLHFIGATVFRVDENPTTPEAHGVFRFEALLTPT